MGITAAAAAAAAAAATNASASHRIGQPPRRSRPSCGHGRLVCSIHEAHARQPSSGRNRWPYCHAASRWEALPGMTTSSARVRARAREREHVHGLNPRGARNFGDPPLQRVRDRGGSHPPRHAIPRQYNPYSRRYRLQTPSAEASSNRKMTLSGRSSVIQSTCMHV